MNVKRSWPASPAMFASLRIAVVVRREPVDADYIPLAGYQRVGKVEPMNPAQPVTRAFICTNATDLARRQRLRNFV